MSAGIERYEIAKGAGLYPARLLELGGEAPAKLYVMGNPELLSRGDLLGVSGTRRPSARGVERAQGAVEIARRLGCGLITGGAEGCEHEAMEAAIEHGVPLVVVAGTGADFLGYPSSTEAAKREVLAHGGAVVSAEPWGQGPRRYCFQRRNAFIAALARCVYLPEHRNLHVADKAIGLGRTVFALPGSFRNTPPEVEVSPVRQRELDLELLGMGVTLCEDMGTVEQMLKEELGERKAPAPVTEDARAMEDVTRENPCNEER